MANVDPKLVEEIKEYLRENDLLSVKRCVLENPNLLECDVDGGDTLLSYSLGQEKEEVASWLISIGARISGHDLAIAAWSGLVEMTRFLMTKTHDPLDADTMCFICSLGHTRVAQLLLESGEASADSVRDGDGTSALMVASANGDIDMVRLLLKHGANVNYRHPKTGQSVLVFMCDKIYDKDDDKKRDYLGVLELLIARGAELDSLDYKGQTALLRALSILGDTGREKAKVARALIEAGARVDIKAEEACALHLACNDFDAQIVKLLLEHGADATERSALPLVFECSPLLLASDLGCLEKVKLLVEYGANVNQVDSDRTPLQMACSGGHLDVVKFLVENGATVNPIDSDRTPLQEACKYGHLDVVKLLVDRGADVNLCSRDGSTPLLGACSGARSFVVAEFLLDNGASVDVQCNSGDSALILSSWHNHPEFVHLLISRGANLELLGNDGLDALETARKRERELKILQAAVDSFECEDEDMGSEFQEEYDDIPRVMATVSARDDSESDYSDTLEETPEPVDDFESTKALLDFVMHSEVARILEVELALSRQVLVAFYDSSIVTLEDCEGLSDDDLKKAGIHAAHDRQCLLQRFAV